MSPYSEVVERQRILIAAEKWAIQVRSIQAHSCDSMHYDDRPEDTAESGVMDIEYNGGWIDRYKNDVVIHTFGDKLSQDELLRAYGRVQSDTKEK